MFLRRVRLLSILTVLLLVPSLYATGTLRLSVGKTNTSWEVSVGSREYTIVSSLDINLEEGVYRLRARAEGFNPVDTPIRIEEGKIESIVLTGTLGADSVRTLEVVQKAGDVLILSSGGFEVFSVDGKFYEGSAELRLGVGEHRLSSGTLVRDFRVTPDTFTAIRFDAAARQVDSWRAPAAAYGELKSMTGSPQELFRLGNRRYGRRIDLSPGQWGLVAAALLCIVLLLYVRYNLSGRIRRATRKARACRRRAAASVRQGKREMAASSLKEHARHRALLASLHKRITSDLKREMTLYERLKVTGRKGRKRRARAILKYRRLLVRLEKALAQEG